MTEILKQIIHEQLSTARNRSGEKGLSLNFIYFTTITKQVIQLILIRGGRH